MKCQNCLTEIDSDEARYIDDVPYCESCFFDSYNYCSVCDVVLHREDIRYDDNGDPFCEDCYHSETDEDCPNNPEVFDCDRETVLCLARNWLKGIKPKCFIKVNRNDFYTKEIQKEVGLVSTPIYFYGLSDRDEYEIKVSPNLLEKAQRYLKRKEIELNHIMDTGANRIGVSFTLRKDQSQLIVNLLKELTTQE